LLKGRSTATASLGWRGGLDTASASSSASSPRRWGAGPVALARAQRAQAARLLVESTTISFAEAALAAGFGSVRQFNDTIRSVYGRTPTELRRRARGRSGEAAPGTIELRLACREPFDGESTIRFLGSRAVPGTESLDGLVYQRSLGLRHGAAVVELTPERGAIRARLRLDDLRDLTAAAARCRRLLDLDADPEAVSGQLGRDGCLGELVRRHPGLRVPGSADGFELAARAIVGQQVTLAGARTVAGRLVERYGEPLDEPHGPVTHLFPTSAALAQVDPSRLSMPRSRARALRELARRVSAGDLCLDSGAEPRSAVCDLLSIPGIGSWTASYIAMRALGDPDAYPLGDAVLRRALEQRGLALDRTGERRLAESWRPWRSYATVHLWQSLNGGAARRD
jgi:AraC family transcriptional regulator, regulatory protein of adaptative response / DNA-3-methyladenine glycosylase II